jgi:hypothetical protein
MKAAVRILLTALGLLTLATSAEGAWVLWASRGGIMEILDDGHESQNACEIAATRLRDSYRTFQPKGAKSPTLLCLPDTIGPRGPKGK